MYNPKKSKFYYQIEINNKKVNLEYLAHEPKSDLHLNYSRPRHPRQNLKSF